MSLNKKRTPLIQVVCVNVFLAPHVLFPALQLSEDSARRQCEAAEDSRLKQQLLVERSSFERRLQQVCGLIRAMPPCFCSGSVMRYLAEQPVVFILD